MGWNAIRGENTKPISENGAKVPGQLAVTPNRPFRHHGASEFFPSCSINPNDAVSPAVTPGMSTLEG